jgi:predicted polyphosphate/ATP-dependent NAD kinase
MTLPTYFRIGLIINPMAGLGGPLALKGSDGVAELALAKGAEPQATARFEAVLQHLAAYLPRLQIFTGSGALGADVCHRYGLETHILYNAPLQTSAQDTQALAQVILEKHADLLLFVGGDGTARDIAEIVQQQLPILGVPAGVKMHSGVFAVTPQAAAKLLEQFLTGKLISLVPADIRDLDEHALRQGQLKTRFYQEVLIPENANFIQQVKCANPENEDLVLEEIAADFIENMNTETVYFMGAGHTVAAIMATLNLPNTLLGIDVIQNQQLLAQDADVNILSDYAEHHNCHIVVSPTNSQGFLFGRGNQQFSSELLLKTLHAGLKNLHILASPRKLSQLNGQPLLIDLNSEASNLLKGYCAITCGYQHHVWYPVNDEISVPKVGN